jgi:hypothetical protein
MLTDRNLWYDARCSCMSDDASHTIVYIENNEGSV